MLTRIVLLAAVCCALVASQKPYDLYSRRYGVCKNNMPSLMTKPTGQTRCTLISGFYAMNTKVTFTASQNTTWTTWIQSLETTIVNNASISNTTDKMNLIAAELQTFALMSPDIYALIQYVNISTWGPPETFVRIANEWSLQGSLQLVVRSDIKGNCKLFDTLLAACTDAPKKMALQSFIDINLKQIIKSKKTQTQIIADIFDAFETKFFIGAQASWKTYFFGLKLKGFSMSYGQFSLSSVTFKRQVTKDVLLSGSSTTCPFILAMNASLYTTGVYTNSQKGYIRQVMEYFQSKWSLNVTVESRMTVISDKFTQSIDFSYGYFGMLNSIPCPGFGSWFDLIIITCQINIIPKTCGCTVPTFPDYIPTTPEMEMTTTTEMPTTTTEMATTTTEMMTTTWDSTTVTMPSTTEQCSCKCEM